MRIPLRAPSCKKPRLVVGHSRPYGTRCRGYLETLGVGALTALSGLSAHLLVLCATTGALAYSVHGRDKLVALQAPGSQEEIVYPLHSGSFGFGVEYSSKQVISRIALPRVVYTDSDSL